MTPGPTDLSVADATALERARSAVMNVLVVVGLGIAASGFFLGRKERGEVLVPPRDLDLWTYGGLMLLCLASVLARRVLASRDRLRDRRTRASRFWTAHVLAAALGALALPLGFAYGWLVRPRIDGVGPFWVVALALGAMAYPRAYALRDLDD